MNIVERLCKSLATFNLQGTMKAFSADILIHDRHCPQRICAVDTDRQNIVTYKDCLRNYYSSISSRSTYYNII